MQLLSRLSAKFQFLPHGLFIQTGQNRIEVHGNIKSCCGFGELLEYSADKLRAFAKIRHKKHMERS